MRQYENGHPLKEVFLQYSQGYPESLVPLVFGLEIERLDRYMPHLYRQYGRKIQKEAYRGGFGYNLLVALDSSLI
jgi:hypothetical protein